MKGLIKRNQIFELRLKYIEVIDKNKNILLCAFKYINYHKGIVEIS